VLYCEVNRGSTADILPVYTRVVVNQKDGYISEVHFAGPDQSCLVAIIVVKNQESVNESYEKSHAVYIVPFYCCDQLPGVFAKVRDCGKDPLFVNDVCCKVHFP